MGLFFPHNKINGSRQELVLIKWFNKVKAVIFMSLLAPYGCYSSLHRYIFKGENWEEECTGVSFPFIRKASLQESLSDFHSELIG